MPAEMPLELRSYLEHIVDDMSERAGMTMLNQKLRERLLSRLYTQLETYILFRIGAALPPPEREQFTSLLEQGESNEALQAFTVQHIPNIPEFVQQLLADFREESVKSGRSL